MKKSAKKFYNEAMLEKLKRRTTIRALCLCYLAYLVVRLVQGWQTLDTAMHVMAVVLAVATVVLTVLSVNSWKQGMAAAECSEEEYHRLNDLTSIHLDEMGPQEDVPEFELDYEDPDEEIADMTETGEDGEN